ncbi:hypothetical protein [Amycolatopsis sp. WGS_07]|uniref:hypothetical protein n=1 Tax=Amycolatopsis sp. WGS_07 TaxID=3076764 RepID=UPI0038732319
MALAYVRACEGDVAAWERIGARSQRNWPPKTPGAGNQPATRRMSGDLTDVRHPRLEAALTGHTSVIPAVTYRLLSAGLDATARPWELNFEEVSARLHP